MKNQLICEKILIILKYSGIAPFKTNESFTIDKNFLYINRIVIFIAFAINIIVLKLFIPFWESPSILTFGPFIAGVIYSTVVVSVLLITYINLNGINPLINEIIRSKEKLLVMLEKNFELENTNLTYSFFITIQMANVMFIIPNMITDLNGFDGSITIMTSFWSYYVSCCDFFYTVLVLNIYHLFKALNENIGIIVKGQEEIYDEECAEKEEKETELNILELTRGLYIESIEILNIADGINNIFEKINFLSLGNSVMAVVGTTFFCFADDRYSSIYERMIIFTFFVSFFVAKTALVLYFSWITTLKVNLCNFNFFKEKA